MDPVDLAYKYREQIEAAMKHSSPTHTFEDVVKEIWDGHLQVWPGDHSVAVTEIREFPQLKILNIVYAGGNLRALEAMMEPILAWGKAQGCSRVMMLGRPGWARSFLARAGWKPTALLMEADL